MGVGAAVAAVAHARRVVAGTCAAGVSKAWRQPVEVLAVGPDVAGWEPVAGVAVAVGAGALVWLRAILAAPACGVVFVLSCCVW